jgi:intein-encoded DNA endonuclease-like protein
MARRNLEDVPWDIVCRLYRSGYTGPRLAKLVGCPPKTIYRKLRERGIKIRKQGKKPNP